MTFSIIATQHGGAYLSPPAMDSTGADLLIAATFGIAGNTFSDNKSNTWTSRTDYGTPANGYCRIWYCYAPTVGSGHTFSISIGYGRFTVIAVSGATASPYDTENGSAVNPGTSLAPGSVTPSQDDEIVVSGVALGGSASSPTVDSGFTDAGSSNGQTGVTFGGALGYKIQTTAAAVNPTWSWSGSYQVAGANATFKASGAAATTPKLIGGNLIRPNLVRGRLVA